MSNLESSLSRDNHSSIDSENAENNYDESKNVNFHFENSRLGLQQSMDRRFVTPEIRSEHKSNSQNVLRTQQ